MHFHYQKSELTENPQTKTMTGFA